MEARNWKSPLLCGCELSITADFLDDYDGYRHPKPGTVEKVDIVSICDDHMAYTLPFSGWQGEFFEDVHHITGERYQARGYMTYEEGPATPGEWLYTYLYRYTGQTVTFGCGCRKYQCVEIVNGRKDVLSITSLKHPLHSMKCYRHHNDGDDCQQAQDWHNENCSTPDDKALVAHD